MIWRDSVGVGSSRLGLKSECTGLFSNRAPLSVCHAILMSYNDSETAVYGLSSRCRVDVCTVNFHVVRSALQCSVFRI